MRDVVYHALRVIEDVGFEDGMSGVKFRVI